MKHLLCIFLLAVTAACNINAREKTTVQQVSNSVTINDALDYHITGSIPFATSGSVDINNKDAVIILDNFIKPSVFRTSYLSHVYIFGEPAEVGVNCYITVHLNGCILYPYILSEDHPLTVYSEINFQGEHESDYSLYTYYKGLGKMQNKIRSFKLKRGHSVCFATNNNGTGYSRYFIAQDEDLEVSDMGKLLNGRIGFIRVFPWNNAAKKGVGGLGGAKETRNVLLNVSWSWNWGASNTEFEDYDYVPSHEQTGWPSWSSIQSNNTANTLLGLCEPDNSVGEAIAVADIESRLMQRGGDQEKCYTTGMRVGAACPLGVTNGQWFSTYMKLCDTYNYRIDFIQSHSYWYANGTYYNDMMNSYYKLYGRPIWITEWNYGANWTKETWPDSDRSGTSANYAHELSGIKDIVTKLESNKYVERYAFYDYVQDCRKLYNDADPTLESTNYLTPTGVWYAGVKSNPAYTNVCNYIPKWNHLSPTNLVVTYNKQSQLASLSWEHWNGKESDSIWIERKIDDGQFIPVHKIDSLVESGKMTHRYDNLSSVSGFITYRIHNFDGDGNERYSGEASFMKAQAQGNNFIQFGRVKVKDYSEIDIPFSEPFETTPAVFMGIPTNNNKSITPTSLISSTSIKKFTYQMFPWQYQKEEVCELSNIEEIGYMAMELGNYTFENMEIEVGSTKAKSDTVDVVFQKQFDDGVTPVVVLDLLPSLTKHPICAKMMDVTNKGFRLYLTYEKGAGTNVLINQTVNYIAATPGVAKIEDVNVIVGNGSNPLYGALFKNQLMKDENDDSLYVADPIILGTLQTSNIKAPTALCLGTPVLKSIDNIKYTTAIRARRIVDDGTDEVKTIASADQLGWIAISNDVKRPNNTTDIEDLEIIESESSIEVWAKDNRIHVKKDNWDLSPDQFEVYTINGNKESSYSYKKSGFYLVKVNNQTKKIFRP